MNFSTNRNSIIRFVTTALAVINMIIVAFGGDTVAIADDKLYIIASIIALVITVSVAVYKNNATTPLGCLMRDIYDLAKKHGASEIYEVLTASLVEFCESDPADDENIDDFNE